MNFTQQYGKNHQRCQQNKFYYAVWQLLLYFYREFSSKILSVHYFKLTRMKFTYLRQTVQHNVPRYHSSFALGLHAKNVTSNKYQPVQILINSFQYRRTSRIYITRLCRQSVQIFSQFRCTILK